MENSNKEMKLFALSSDIQEAIWIKESVTELLSSYSKKYINAFRIVNSIIKLNIVKIRCEYILSFYILNKKIMI